MNDAWCHRKHDRHGLVSNQDRHAAYDKSRPLAMVSTCDRTECIARGIKYVAGETNETARYQEDPS